MFFSRFINSSIGGFLSVLVVGLVLATPAISGEKMFTEDFERPDSYIIGNGWKEILSGGECVTADAKFVEEPQNNLFFQSKKKSAIANPLQREIDQEIYDSRLNRSTISPEATAELQDGQVFLHFEENQPSQLVQKDIDKRVTRIAFDYTPLYAMGGMDDRAWLGMRIFFLDSRDHILGEIRSVYYNVVFSDLENSDTIYSITSQGPFDGATRHTEIDAQQILKERLTGIDPERVAKTRISLEISSNICGSTVEGYFDNINLTLADATGLHRFNQEEILSIIHVGADMYDSNPDDFPGNWIDTIVATYGREKLSKWLNEIPRDVGARPAKLAKLMSELYSLDGKNSFVVAYGVSILLYHF
ncbi:MAG: hypothetical protein HQL69_18240 [Magnetococcales bacterium]|nr:hypothetical protein [Magnetococcales bacterium]